MSYKPILCLDIDGVFWHYAYLNKLKAQPGYVSHARQEEWDPEAICRLNTIVDATGCEILITSTHRILTPLNKIIRRFIEAGYKHPRAVVGVTPCIQETCLLQGKQDRPWNKMHRGVEITAWLELNRPGFASPLAIVDDDADMWDLMDRRIRTSMFEEGLREDIVPSVIQMLQTPWKGIPNSAIAILSPAARSKLTGRK